MYVYIFGWDGAGPVKIGIAGDLAQRQSALQTALPFPAMMYRAYRCGDAAPRVEVAAHVRLRDRELCGEWFAVSVTQAEGVIIEAATGLGVGWTRWRRPTRPGESTARERRDNRAYASPLVMEAMGGADAAVERFRRRRAREGLSAGLRAEAVALARSVGNVKRAAEALGVRRETLHRWAKDGVPTPAAPP